ncbi:type I-G CRISPR-associated protein Cas8g1/Csx17 [Gordonia polyisoprenivorans]|uniref:type I-G CRISPR-associated protein Cas8g1/Csx17 n=1 Tax=Gordonia polyisoprenivorans TaxID=84595 RepID=UPI001AD63193|nr:type I-U CRISPR-associated protein Csx17 [Gordonia polyisoprenivorans]QTI68154.1 type I-U CRISPR-associated protein Csx17 [Gordonia polyisoprenivorans]
MTEHRFVAARGRNLQRSLAALGLVRVLAEQRDPDLRSRVDGDDLVIDTTVEDIARWLVDEYRPRPVLSPWNGGSGFGEKDRNQRAILDDLINFSDRDRVSVLRGAVGVVDRLLEHGRAEGWDKRDLIREIGNTCPDEMLPWLRSAVVVLGNDDLAFPPLLGSGGNDGRLEFSSNYHQRLLDVLPTDAKAERSSLGWAQDALAGTSREKLVKASVGQFDPGTAGTPNSSAYGAAPAVVNPWLFVLMVEGATLFEAGPARRISAQSSVDKGAAMTFMTRGSSAGFDSGSDDEDIRGEVWLPWWHHWLRWPAIQRIFVEGRATWRGKTATRSGDMYLAVGTQGVSAVVSEFDRFSIAKRNGLAFSAIRADAVGVDDDQLLRVVALVEDWPQRLSGRTGLPGTVTEELRRFDSARVDLVRTKSRAEQVGQLQLLLSSLTRLEVAVGRSRTAKESVRPRATTRGSGQEMLEILRAAELLDALTVIPEFRLALGLASLRFKRRDGRWAGPRDLLLPVVTGPAMSRPAWGEGSEVAGYGIRPLTAVMTDLLARVAIEAGAMDEVAGPGGASASGITMPSSIPVPLAHLHQFVIGGLDDEAVARWFDALLVFDWRGERMRLGSSGSNLVPPQPALGILGLLRDGITAHAVKAHGQEEGFDDQSKGLTAEVVGALVRGNLDRAVTLARQRIHETGLIAVSVISSRSDTERIATALLPRSGHHALAQQFAFSPTTIDDPPRSSDPTNDHQTESEAFHGQ